MTADFGLRSENAASNLGGLMQSAGTESTWFDDLLVWVQEHRNLVIAGGIGLLVVIVAGYVINWERHQIQLAANHALLSVTQRAAPQDSPPTPAELLQVADEYPGSNVAERAILLAAGRAYENGDYAEAEKQFRAHLKEFPNSLFAAIASLGVAASLDAQDKTQEAITAYEQTIAAYADDPLADRARLDLATIYEDQNQPAQALRVYDQMTDKAGFSQIAFEATTRRQQLLAKHPELAPEPTNAAPATLTSPAGTNVEAAITTTNAPAAASNVVAAVTNALAAATNAVPAAVTAPVDTNATPATVTATTNAPAAATNAVVAPATNAPAGEAK